MNIIKTHKYIPELNVDDRVIVELDKANINIIKTAEGIIIDTYTKDHILINTQTIWNDDIDEWEDEHDN